MDEWEDRQCMKTSQSLQKVARVTQSQNSKASKKHKILILVNYHIYKQRDFWFPGHLKY